MRVIAKTGGNTSTQDMGGFNGDWSGGSQLWWQGAKPGDTLDLNVAAPTAGKYVVKAQFTKARDYGIAQFSLDGQKLGDPIDFYHDGVITTGELTLGTVDLTAGDHKFTVAVTGANDKADKAYLVGVDYVKLEAVK